MLGSFICIRQNCGILIYHIAYLKFVMVSRSGHVASQQGNAYAISHLNVSALAHNEPALPSGFKTERKIPAGCRQNFPSGSRSFAAVKKRRRRLLYGNVISYRVRNCCFI